MRALVTLAIAACLLLVPAPARASIVPGPLADLQMQLLQMSVHAPGHVAMQMKDISTGFTSGVNSNASMPAASTIKIPVMVEVFRQLAQGTFDFNTPLVLRRADKDWGSGSLCDRPAGTRYPVSQLLTAMITVSDNTATNMLIRLVGRQNINATMVSMGLQHTKLKADIRSEGDGIRSALRSSPADMVSLLSQMAKDELIDGWSSRQMIAILTGQRHNSLLPEPLPLDIPIAHKTGTLHDTLNDVGIVYAQAEPYIIAVMTTNLPSLASGRRFIRGVSRVAYDDYMRFGAWRENNPLGEPAQTSSPQELPAAQAPVPEPEPTVRPLK